MTDLTINLPDDLHARLVLVAAAGGIDPEKLVRQILAVRVGVNRSSKEDPFSSVLLRNRPEDLLDLARTKPVFIRDVDHGDFVIVAQERYNDGSAPE
ncbi:hypothetical protein [Thalassococcus sp. S3]|uniref:hypothetical protein n=1 Tax=Thalassococcus sp. S3 TaxID=2017482 RepID=UPI00102453D7|nr:hypothetical protein [Thalassococcus sp. S3]QBF30776.1 hypothetical protein CFI11_06035 [Thalassococcus sp. S3]